jgi:ABC-type lipoprotein release transport system permease subunit
VNDLRFALRPHLRKSGEAAATAALLMFVVLVAAWLPARRAARIEPTLTLKGD